MPVVLLTDPIAPVARAELEKTADVRLLGEAQVGTLEKEMLAANVVIVRRSIPADILRETKVLRALVRHGVGLDFIPLEEASAANIAVTNTPNTNAQSVAEYAFGLLLGLQRRIAQNNQLIRTGKWHELRSEAPELHEIANKTLGIIGFGSIGAAIARIGHFGFGAKVLAARRNCLEGPNWVEFSSITDVASRADILVIACPLTPSTQGMVDARFIRSMRKNSILVNVARGAIIDETALAVALQTQQISGAALDVFSHQPLLEDSPLRDAPNLVLSPHIAGVTHESMLRMSNVAVSDTVRILNGKRPENLVNAQAWPKIVEQWARSPI